MAAASLALAGTAQADRISPPPPPPPPVDDGGGGGGGGGYEIGGETDPAKEFEVGMTEAFFAYQPGEDLYLSPEQLAAGMWKRTGVLEARSTMPFRGSYLRASFRDDYSYSFPWYTSAVIRKGSSHSVWYGLRPFNANRIVHHDHFWSTGLNVTVSTGGASFSVNGSSVDWRAVRTNDWQVHHTYQGLRFDGIQLFTIGHQLASDFAFENENRTLYVSDRDLLD